MITKQTIAIIRAPGNMDLGISKSLAKGNYRLLHVANLLNKLQTPEAEILKENPADDIEIAQQLDVDLTYTEYQNSHQIGESVLKDLRRWLEQNR